MVKIKTQAQYDKIKSNFSGSIEIIGGSEYDRIKVNRNFENAEQSICEQAYADICGSSTVKNIYDSATVKNIYDSATVENIYGSATVEYICGSATVKNIYDSATVKNIYDSATVKNIYDSATVKNIYDSATVENIYGSATVENIYGSATVEYICDSATVKNIYDSAKLLLVSGLASVLMITGNASVTTAGFNIVRTYTDETKTSLKLSKNTTLIKLDRSITQPTTFDGFKQMYPTVVKGTKTIMYKAVHKDGDKYFSDYDKSFTYEIGKKITGIVKGKESCNQGLHISYKWWAIRFGSGWDNMALLECEVAIKNIVVSSDTDGKVRTSELKVIREVPESEW